MAHENGIEKAELHDRSLIIAQSFFMEILVTGSSGYIGWELCKRLAADGHAVKAFCRTKPNLQSVHGIEWITGDVLSLPSVMHAMKNCTWVFHTASLDKRCHRHHLRYFEVNVDGTSNVLKAAACQGVERVVYTSSDAVLGPSLNSPLREDDIRIASFNSDYELSKYQAEKKVMEYAASGGDAVIVVPSLVFGPGPETHTNNVRRLIRQFISRGYYTVPGNGTAVKNYAFIDDVVQGHLLAAEKGAIAGRYHLGGLNISYNQFYAMLSELTGLQRRAISIPCSLMKIFAGLDSSIRCLLGANPVLTGAVCESLYKDKRLSCEKAVRELGYSVTPLPEALRRTIIDVDPHFGIPKIPALYSAIFNQPQYHGKDIRSYHRSS